LNITIAQRRFLISNRLCAIYFGIYVPYCHFLEIYISVFWFLNVIHFISVTTNEKTRARRGSSDIYIL